MRNITKSKRLYVLLSLAVCLVTCCGAGGESSIISPEELLAITQSQNADSLIQAYESTEMLGYAKLLTLSLKAYELKPDSTTSHLLARTIPDTRLKAAVFLSLVRLMFAEGPQDTTSRLFASIPERTGYVSEETLSKVATTGPE